MHALKSGKHGKQTAPDTFMRIHAYSIWLCFQFTGFEKEEKRSKIETTMLLGQVTMQKAAGAVCRNVCNDVFP